LDAFAKGQPAELRIDVEGALAGEEHFSRFDPLEFCQGKAPELKRPAFLGIVASATLAMTLAKKASGQVNGFVVEGPTAGGHNAPPRGPLQLTADGEPLYGERDSADLEKIKALGLPFWLAGSYGRPGKLKEALDLGATGVQVGTAFAFCEEGGVDPELKRLAFQLSREKKLRVFTDPKASPTGFPFKVASMPGTISEQDLYEHRDRVCDLGYLRRLYRRADGSLGYRCPSEPIDAFLKKGGKEEDTIGRKCICNSLPATVGFGQVRDNGHLELPIVTGGDDLANISDYLTPEAESYTAADVVRVLLAGIPENDLSQPAELEPVLHQG